MRSRRHLTITITLLFLFILFPTFNLFALSLEEDGKGVNSFQATPDPKLPITVPQSVIKPSDGRRHVNNAEIAPWHSIVFIKSSLAGKLEICTGSLINREYVLTAAHCISSHRDGTFVLAESIAIAAGYNGFGAPFGGWRGPAGPPFIPNEWVNSRAEGSDYAVVKITPNYSPSLSVFDIGYFSYSSLMSESNSYIIAGYPRDKCKIIIEPFCELWYGTGPLEGVYYNTIKYKIDMEEGQSGSAVWMYNKNPTLIGVNTAEQDCGLDVGELCPPDTLNFGVRINPGIIRFLRTNNIPHNFVTDCIGTLNIRTEGGGKVIHTPAETGGCDISEYVSGALISLGAKAEPGWEFSRWLGGPTGGATTNFTIYGPATITAVFKKSGGGIPTPQPTLVPTAQPTPPPDVGQQVKLYRESNYRGGVAYSQGPGFSTAPDDGGYPSYSLEIPANWSVWTYRGDDPANSDKRCWKGSVPNLQDHGWQNAIEAMLVQTHDDCPTNPTPVTGVWTAKYYTSDDYWNDMNNPNRYMCERSINGPNLDWNYLGGPPPCDLSMNPDHWVAEYKATINFSSGTYAFGVIHDDRMRLWLNGNMIYENGSSTGFRWVCPTRALNGNQNLRVMLHELAGDARIHLTWTQDPNVCNPSTPGNFRAGSITHNSITLNWNNVENEEGYNIYKWNGVEYAYLTSKSKDVTGHLDSGLECNREYHYQISSTRPGFESAHTDPLQVTTADCPTPQTPGNLRTQDKTEDSITLAWDNISNETGYKLYRWKEIYGVWDFWHDADINANVTTFTYNDLSCGQTYYYQISARNDFGESPRSSTHQESTRCQDTLTMVSGSIQLAPIGFNVNPGNLPIRVYLTPSGSTEPTFSSTVETDVNGKFTVVGVSPGQYRVRVKGVNTLSDAKTVTLNAGLNAMGMFTLAMGNAYDDNIIDLSDYSVLVVDFLEQGRERSDFNRDGITDIEDYYVLIANFFKTGVQLLQTDAPNSENVTLHLLPAMSEVKVDNEFDIQIQVETGGQPIFAVQSLLNFDPSLLQVVSITPGNDLPELWRNSYDNVGGKINFVAAQRNEPYPSGTFTLATFRMRAISQTESTSISFSTTFPRVTKAIEENGPTLVSLQDASITIVSDASPNMVLNSGFEQPGKPPRIPAHWTAKNLKRDRRICNIAGAAKEDNCAFQFQADPGTRSSIVQIITDTGGSAGDILTLSAWVQGQKLKGARIWASISYFGGGTAGIVELRSDLLNIGTYGYKQLKSEIQLTATVKKIRVEIRQNIGKGRLRVDEVSVTVRPADALRDPSPIPDALPDMRGSN